MKLDVLPEIAESDHANVAGYRKGLSFSFYWDCAIAFGSPEASAVASSPRASAK
jgi:hypothetical protein